MNEHELEAMVVRLIGDGSSYAKMMTDAQRSTQQAADAVQQQASRIEGFKKNLAGFAVGAISALSALGVTNWLRGSVGAWNTQEEATIRLEAAIESNGRSVRDLMPMYEEASSRFQGISRVGDEASQSMYAMAESFGVSGQAAIDASEAAVSLAAINGGSAQAYLRFTAAYVQGDTERMRIQSRMIHQLRGITNEQELMARSRQLIATGMQTEIRLTRTFMGQMDQLKGLYGDLMEEVGKIATEIIKPVVEFGKTAVKWLQSLSPETKKLVVTLALIGAAVLSLAAVWPLIAAIAGPALIAVKGLILAIVSPIGIVVALVTGLAIAIVNRLGGIGVVWGFIKEKALAFWNWFRPIWLAFVGFASAAWNLIVKAAGAAFDFIMSIATRAGRWIANVWERVFGSASVSWSDIGDMIRDTFIFAEFVLDNFEAAADILWVSLKLGWSSTVDQWQNGMRTVGRAFRELIDFMGDAWEMLTAVLTGEMTFAELSNSLGRALGEALAGIAEQIGDNVSDETRRLQGELGRLTGAFMEDFEAFRLRRIAEMNVEDRAESRRDRDRQRERDRHRERMGEIQQIDAALLNSAEAMSRVMAFQERIRVSRLDERPAAARPAGEFPAIPVQAPPVPQPVERPAIPPAPRPVGEQQGPAQPEQVGPRFEVIAERSVEALARRLLPVLGQIQVNTRRVANQPPVEVAGANIGGGDLS